MATPPPDWIQIIEPVKLLGLKHQQMMLFNLDRQTDRQADRQNTSWNPAGGNLLGSEFRHKQHWFHRIVATTVCVMCANSFFCQVSLGLLHPCQTLRLQFGTCQHLCLSGARPADQVRLWLAHRCRGLCSFWQKSSDSTSWEDGNDTKSEVRSPLSRDRRHSKSSLADPLSPPRVLQWPSQNRSGHTGIIPVFVTEAPDLPSGSV